MQSIESNVSNFRVDPVFNGKPAKLIYANSIMYGMSATNMHKLQSAQNSLTRVVLPSICHLSASERLSYLHWLPVHYEIQFTVTTQIP